jgi:hypothetical protein
MKNKETRDFALDQEPLSRIITRYAIVEDLYLSDKSPKMRATKTELKTGIIQLYTKVLIFQADVMKYLNQNKGGILSDSPHSHPFDS